MAPAEAGGGAPPGRIEVTVVYCPPAPGMADEVTVTLAADASVRDALAASGLPARQLEMDIMSMPLALWGRLCGPDDPLRDRDRIEVLRPLQVDPKEARRRRQQLARGER